MSTLKYIVIGGGVAVGGFLLYQYLTKPTASVGDNVKKVVDGATGIVNMFRAAAQPKTAPAPGQSNPLATDNPTTTAIIPGGQSGSAVSDATGVRMNRQLAMQPFAPTPSAKLLGGNYRGNPYEIRPMPVAKF